MNDIYSAFKESRDSSDHLKHYGIIGMKWGQRLYQNKDGTLTPAGKLRYSYKEKYSDTALRKQWAEAKKDSKWSSDKSIAKAENRYKYSKEFDEKLKEFNSEYKGLPIKKATAAYAVEIADKTGRKATDPYVVRRARGKAFLNGVYDLAWASVGVNPDSRVSDARNRYIRRKTRG